MTTINIIFSTQNEDNTNNIIASIIKSNDLDQNKNYELAITIFDKTQKQNLQRNTQCLELNIKTINIIEVLALEKKHIDVFKKANGSSEIDSIQRARIQQQIYVIEHFETFKNTIIWQVDDDMLFGKTEIINNKHHVNYSTNYFSKITNLYFIVAENSPEHVLEVYEHEDVITLENSPCVITSSWTSDFNEIEVYPNPTSGIVYLPNSSDNWEVYTLFGEKVLESSESVLDMSSYPKGVYIFRVGNSVQKVVLE